VADPNADDRAYRELIQRIRLQITDVEQRIASTQDADGDWYLRRRLRKLYRLEVAITRQYPELSPDP
jgi:hypothetical protein